MWLGRGRPGGGAVIILPEKIAQWPNVEALRLRDERS